MENENKVKDTPEEEKEKKEFIARLTSFIIVGFITPIIYLICRYNLFRPGNPSVTIGLWGVIVFAIIIGLVGTLCWYYIESMKFKYSIWKQIITGAVKVLAPLAIAALMLQVVKDNVDMMIESLWVFFGCEALAIPLNPLPKWCFEHNIDSAGDIAKKIYDKVTKEDNTSVKQEVKQEETKTEAVE